MEKPRDEYEDKLYIKEKGAVTCHPAVCDLN